MSQHTILLLQRNKLKSSRTFQDHESVGIAIEALIHSYEQKRKEDSPELKVLTYDLKDLLEYVNKMTECVALVFSAQTQSYVPRDKDWIKEKLTAHLKAVAALP